MNSMVMARICTAPDIATILRGEASDFPGIMIVEDAAQPEGFSPKIGWDFMAPESTRQFHVEVGEDWALVTLDVAGDVLVFDVPAYNRTTEHLVEVVATVVTAVAEVARTRNIRLGQNRGKDDLSAAVIDTVAQ